MSCTAISRNGRACVHPRVPGLDVCAGHHMRLKPQPSFGRHVRHKASEMTEADQVDPRITERMRAVLED
jgi:hypothetical protein